MGPAGPSYGGKRFELWFVPRAGGWRLAAAAHWFSCCGVGGFDGVRGAVNINTLDWREGAPIQMRCELSHTCRQYPRSTETINFCGEVIPTRDERSMAAACARAADR